MTLRVSSRSSADDFAAPSVTAATATVWSAGCDDDDVVGHDLAAREKVEGEKAATELTRVARRAIFMTS